MPRGRRQILGLTEGIWRYQVLTPYWDDGAYDDILDRISRHGSLDYLGGDLDANWYRGDRIGPPYGFTLALRAKRARAEEEARHAEQMAAWEARQRQRAEEHRQRGEEAWSKVRRDPVPSGDVYTCPKCGYTEAIMLPPPGWNRVLSGRFLYTCGGCEMLIGMISKRLTAESEAVRQIVGKYGWPTHLRFMPRSLPPRVSMVAGC